MPRPTITALPPAPAETDAVADFEAKALEFVASLSPFGGQVNDVAAWVDTAAEATEAAQLAAESAAQTAAADALATANIAVNEVYSARDQAVAARVAAVLAQLNAAGYASDASDHKDAALAAAAAAAAGAGLPALAGNAGAPLRVKSDETGVEYGYGPAGRLRVPGSEPEMAACGDVFDVRTSERTIVLPADPIDADWVTVIPNGFSPALDPQDNTIGGVADTITVDVDRPFMFVFISELSNWRVF